MWEKIVEAGTGAYILWGIGFLGLLLKIITDTYLNVLIRASENMATSKKRKLYIIKKKYENGRSLGIREGSGEAFAEKSVRGLKLGPIPLEAWRRSGYTLCCIVGMIMAGSILYYDVSWRGSPQMEAFFANGFLVCAFLLCLENIFLINNKIEILKANIRDYLENLTPVRNTVQRSTSPQILGKESRHGKESTGIVMPELAATNVYDTAVPQVENLEGKPVPSGDTSVNTGYNERDSNEELLNSFLKEFFS